MITPEFQSLFRQNPMPMWVFDKNSLQFLAVNEALVRLYGYSEEEFLQMNITEIWLQEDAAAFLEELRQLEEETERTNQRQWHHQRKDGRSVYVSLIAHNQLFREQNASLVLVQDVTAKVQTQRLEDLYKRLLEKIARDASTEAIFTELCEGIETINTSLFCAVMQVDSQHKHLHLIASARLPNTVKYQISQLSADSHLTPTGKLFQTAENETVELFINSGLAPYPEVFEHTDIVSCWSVPVFSHTREIIASFDFYHRQEKNPDVFSLHCATIGQKIVAIVMERDQKKQQLTQFFYNMLDARREAEEDRLRSMEHLRSSENRFRALAESSPDIIYLERFPERKIEYINRKEVFGYSNEEFIAQQRNTMIFEEDLRKIQLFWHHSKTTELPHIELQILNAKGETEWVSARLKVMSRYADDSIEQLLVTLTLITEQKKIEKSLEEGRAGLQALIENTTDGIWAINRDFELTVLNSNFKTAYKDFFGYTIKVGDNILTKATEDMAETWKLLYVKALKGERFRRELNFHAQGRDVFYEVSFNPIRTKKGIVEGASVFSRNITAKKISENELVKANFELDSFVYRTSHDLRAPLRSVLGLIGLVQTEEEAEQRNHYVSLIEKSVHRLDHFIDDLTNFSRNSRLVVDPVAIDFDAILDECAADLRYMEHAARVTLHRDVRQEGPFYSDPSRISIILQNLLSNAVKYQRMLINDAFVSVSIHVNGGQARIITTDNGIGIEPEHIPRIFEMFFRASSKSYGSGLGLYITKQVVEKLHGNIRMESQLEQGTVFEIVLPSLQPLSLKK